MARSRTHRRRRWLRLAAVVVVVAVIVGFWSDVSSIAHHQTSAQRTENLSFATLAGNLITQENAVDRRLATLLSSGADLTRVAFAADVASLEQQISQWRDLADQLRTPVLSPSLNLTLSQETISRALDMDVVLADVTTALELSGPRVSGGLSLGRAQLSLASTAASWGAQRHELASAPGAVTLPALTALVAHASVPTQVDALVASPSLAPTRAIVISAVLVQPAALPAATGTLELPPTASFDVQVAASNLREISQPVVLSVVFTPTGGVAQRVTSSTTLAPMSSFAFDRHVFATHPDQLGTLVVTLTGPAGSTGLLHQRTYAVHVVTSSSG